MTEPTIELYTEPESGACVVRAVAPRSWLEQRRFPKYLFALLLVRMALRVLLQERKAARLEQR